MKTEVWKQRRKAAYHCLVPCRQGVAVSMRCKSQVVGPQTLVNTTHSRLVWHAMCSLGLVLRLKDVVALIYKGETSGFDSHIAGTESSFGYKALTHTVVSIKVQDTNKPLFFSLLYFCFRTSFFHTSSFFTWTGNT